MGSCKTNQKLTVTVIILELNHIYQMEHGNNPPETTESKTENFMPNSKTVKDNGHKPILSQFTSERNSKTPMDNSRSTRWVSNISTKTQMVFQVLGNNLVKMPNSKRTK